MKGNPAVTGGSLKSKPTRANTPRVFGHVGFFVGGEVVASNEKVPEASVTQQALGKGVTIMGGKADVVKGKIKEVAGALTGNDRLRAEGNADQAVGKVKQAAAKFADNVKKALK
ncbi:MAG: CsbD family protein [Planctomycetota bacterium]|nr:CsbD family protein [Planctomycetota bacterium]